MLLSWHIADELMPKLTERGFKGGYIVPLPTPRVVHAAQQKVLDSEHSEAAFIVVNVTKPIGSQRCRREGRLILCKGDRADLMRVSGE